MTPFETILFLSAGILTGIVNTLAGSGSLITLPIFIFICGLPPQVANATNRIGILAQNIVAVKTYHGRGHLPPIRHLWWFIIPSMLASIVGARIAIDMDEQMMNTTLGIVMVVMLIVTLLKPSAWLRTRDLDGADPSRRPLLNILLFIGVGLYGGFIQAGVGIFMIASLVLVSKYDLIQSNAIKVLLGLLFNVPAFAIFLLAGDVHWRFGLLMAVCQAIGAYIGVRFADTHPNAKQWIRYLLLAVIAISAARFLGLMGT